MKIALALSGGGARCLAQLGYIDTITTNFPIEIAMLSGSSGGAIAAAFLAMKKSPKEILEILQTFPFQKIKLNIFKGSLFNHLPLYEELQKLGCKDFKSLSIPLFITLTGFDDGKSYYVKSGDLAKAMLASSALLPLFPPVSFENKLYIDGGLSDNLPLKPLHTFYKVAINVNPLHLDHFSHTLWGNFKRAGYILLNAHMQKELAHTYIEIEGVEKFGILDRKNFAKIYALGEAQAQKDLRMWEEICLKNC